jgi:hypothetical protein
LLSPTCALAGLVVAVALETGQPVTEIAGLEAWYDVASLHERMRGGERVAAWKDSSGNGHDLQDDETGPHAVFQILQVNGEPAVQIRKTNTHSVTKPFDLGDHTIFLVYSAREGNRALFQSDVAGKEPFGVVLRDAEGRDYYKHGRHVIPYGVPHALGTDFNVTVLGRDSGTFHSFINGRDVSSGVKFSEPIRIGRFFGISLTRFKNIDGDGLRIVEMIVYNRYLTDAERKSVTAYLSERYGIQPAIEVAGGVEAAPSPVAPNEAAVRVALGSSSSRNLNDTTPLAIAWSTQRKVEAPFRHDPASDSTRLHCTRDNTRVRLFASLPVRTSADGANVRFLVLKNDAEYQPVEGSTGPLNATEGQAATTVVLATTLVLNAGDYVEVVTVAQGAPGEVTLEPGKALLTAEVTE